MLTLEQIKRLPVKKHPPVMDPRINPRIVQYRKIRKMRASQLPSEPFPFDVQAQLGITDTNMFDNDTLGCCVVSSGYHNEIVITMLETGKPIAGTDDEVKTVYFALTGGQDTGLVITVFLDYWRDTGIPVQGSIHKIYAYAAVDWTNHDEVMEALYYIKNNVAGLMLPLDAQTQLANGQPWTVTTGPGAAPGSWGGHGIETVAYLEIIAVNADGVVFETWGKRQLATWPWVDKYVDEYYVIIPSPSIPNSPIDPALLSSEMAQIQANPLPPSPPEPTPTPSKCSLGNVIASADEKLMNALFMQKLRGRQGRFRVKYY